VAVRSDFSARLAIRLWDQRGFGWTHAVFLVLFDELSKLPHECCVCRRAECYGTFPGSNSNGGGVPDVRLAPFEVASYCCRLVNVEVRAPVTLVPMISPETTSSTRRFIWRPAAVALSATGVVLPNPRAVTLSRVTP